MVEVSATLNLLFPSKWGVLLRRDLPTLRELRGQFHVEINRLRVEDPISFEDLLTPRQLELRGWGTGVAREAP